MQNISASKPKKIPPISNTNRIKGEPGSLSTQFPAIWSFKPIFVSKDLGRSYGN